MAALIDQIAEAVRVELAAGTFSLPFTPTVKAVPVHDLKDIGVLQVTIVTKGATEELFDRIGLTQEDHQIDVGIQQRVTVETQEADVIALKGLAEEIRKYMKKRPLPGLNQTDWISTDQPLLYDVEALRERQAFFSFLTLTYRSLVGP